MTETPVYFEVYEGRKVKAALVSFNRELERLCGQVTPTSVIGYSSESKEIMAYSYFELQKKHFAAVLRLAGDRYYQSANLILRVMFEGSLLLEWALKKPDERCSLWHNYLALEEYGGLYEMPGLISLVQPPRLIEAIRSADEVATAYLNKKGNRRKRKGRNLDASCFRRSWYSENLYEIAEDLGYRDLYNTIYRGLSKKIHWSPMGVRDSLCLNHKGLFDPGHHAKDGIVCLFTSFSIMVACLRLHIKSFNIDASDSFKLLEKRFINYWENEGRTVYEKPINLER